MKKAMAALLAAALSLSLAACGGAASGSETAEAESTASAEAAETAEPTEVPEPTLEPGKFELTGTIHETSKAYQQEISDLYASNGGTMNAYLYNNDFYIELSEPVTFELDGQEITADTVDVYWEDYNLYGESEAIHLIDENYGGTFRMTGSFYPTEHANGDVVAPEGDSSLTDIYFYPNGNYYFNAESVEILSDPYVTPDVANSLPEITVEGSAVFTLNEHLWDLANVEAQYNDYTFHYPDYGITFSEPITTEVDGEQVELSSARLEISTRVPVETRSFDIFWPDGVFDGGPYKLTGAFAKDEYSSSEEYSGPYQAVDGPDFYYYSPYGEYVFYITSAEKIG